MEGTMVDNILTYERMVRAGVKQDLADIGRLLGVLLL